MLRGLNLASKLLPLLLTSVAFGVACSSKSPPVSTIPPGPSSPAGTSTPTPAASTPTPATLQLSSLSLIYLDSSKGGTQTDVYTAAFDGGSPRRVASLSQAESVMDLRGKTLAVMNGDSVEFIDLMGASAALTVPVPGPAPAQPPVGTVTDGRFVDDHTFIFTTGTRCGNGPVGSGLFKVDIAATPRTATQLVGLSTPNATIAGIDPASGVVAVAPRGCDVAFRSIDLYTIADGKLLGTTPTPGCGWAIASPSLKKALVAWRSCNEPGTAHAGIELTVYDLDGGKTAGHDLKSPNGNAITQPAVLRPGQPQAAVATANTAPGPGAAASTGFWLLNLTDQSFKPLTPGSGAEQAPIGWSPDGRYLLVETVLAGGVCNYAYIDVVASDVHTLNKDITFCGTNGEVIGWTVLR